MIPGPRRRRRSPLRTAGGCLILIIGLALFTGAMELFWTRVDERRFPWGYARPGRSTLTGTWVGTFTTGGGARRALYIDLRLDSLNFSSGRSYRRNTRSGAYRRADSRKLEGAVRMCGGAAREQRFEISGNNDDEGATRFWLGLSVADSIPADGFAPSHIRGRWDGRDSIAIEADVYLRKGASAISGTDDPDTGPPAKGGMRRADEAEYRALCARIR